MGQVAGFVPAIGKYHDPFQLVLGNEVIEQREFLIGSDDIHLLINRIRCHGIRFHFQLFGVNGPTGR